MGGNLKTENGFGTWGQVASKTVPHREGALSYPVSYTYGGLGWVRSMNFAEGGSVSYSYNQNHATVTNTDGRNRRYVYQEDGKSAQVLEEDDNGNLTVATNYSYDALGRLLTISQGIQTRSFTYDNLGRLKSETHPESGTTLYTYDNASSLATKTDARGITTQYYYHCFCFNSLDDSLLHKTRFHV